jgi:hypothetical protein
MTARYALRAVVPNDADQAVDSIFLSPCEELLGVITNGTALGSLEVFWAVDGVRIWAVGLQLVALYNFGCFSTRDTVLVTDYIEGSITEFCSRSGAVLRSVVLNPACYEALAHLSGSVTTFSNGVIVVMDSAEACMIISLADNRRWSRVVKAEVVWPAGSSSHGLSSWRVAAVGPTEVAGDSVVFILPYAHVPQQLEVATTDANQHVAADVGSTQDVAIIVVHNILSKRHDTLLLGCVPQTFPGSSDFPHDKSKPSAVPAAPSCLADVYDTVLSSDLWKPAWPAIAGAVSVLHGTHMLATVRDRRPLSSHALLDYFTGSEEVVVHHAALNSIAQCDAKEVFGLSISHWAVHIRHGCARLQQETTMPVFCGFSPLFAALRAAVGRDVRVMSVRWPSRFPRPALLFLSTQCTRLTWVACVVQQVQQAARDRIEAMDCAECSDVKRPAR